MYACRVGLHDREPAERWAREDCADAGRGEYEEPRCGGEIVLLLLLRLRSGYTTTPPGGDGTRAMTECEMQAARLDDDGRVDPVDRGVVREPGGREHLHGAAEVGVVTDGSVRKWVGRGVGGERCSRAWWYHFEGRT